MLTICVLGILLLSTNAVARLVALPLESGYSHDPLPHDSADAIVIVSGTVHPPTVNQPYDLAGQDTYERVRHGAWLSKNWKTLPILLCGGRFRGSEAYAESMRRFLESEGIAPDLIWVEDRSRSTHENAVYGSEILREHGISRIALVVEANSMWRASAAFRKTGLIVVPAPIRFTELHYDLNDVWPDWRAIALNGEAIHELVGLVWYRLRGWI